VNPFDQFDNVEVQQQEANPFDQFDEPQSVAPSGGNLGAPAENDPGFVKRVSRGLNVGMKNMELSSIGQEIAEIGQDFKYMENFEANMNRLQPGWGKLSPAYIESFSKRAKENNAKLEVLLKQVGDVKASIASVPQDPDTTAFHESKGWKGAIDAFGEDPVGIASDLVLQSAPASLKSLGAFALSRGMGQGNLASGVAAGGVSGVEEFGSGYLQLREKGMSHNEAWQKASIKGSIVGAFDTASMGVATSAAKSIVGKPMLDKVATGVMATGKDAALGAGGEAVGSVASGQEVQPTAVLGEMIGEAAFGPVNIATARTADVIKAHKTGGYDLDEITEDKPSGLDATELEKPLSDEVRDSVAKEAGGGTVNASELVGENPNWTDTSNIKPLPQEAVQGFYTTPERSPDLRRDRDNALYEEYAGNGQVDLEAVLTGDVQQDYATVAQMVEAGAIDPQLAQQYQDYVVQAGLITREQAQQALALPDQTDNSLYEAGGNIINRQQSNLVEVERGNQEREAFVERQNLRQENPGGRGFYDQVEQGEVTNLGAMNQQMRKNFPQEQEVPQQSQEPLALPYQSDNTIYTDGDGNIVDRNTVEQGRADTQGIERQEVVDNKIELAAQRKDRRENPGGRGFYDQTEKGATPQEFKELNTLEDLFIKADEIGTPEAENIAVKLEDGDISIEQAQVELAAEQAELDRDQADSVSIEDKANEAATSPKNDLKEPTTGQKEAGNYKKGRIEIHGMPIAIENPKGSTRSGTDPDGKSWENEIHHHYGDLSGTKGADGDALDVFVGENPESEKVWVIDQVNEDGSFDEHKIMLGFTHKAKAISGYKKNYQRGWKVGPVTEMSIDELKAWVKDGDTTKPVSKELGSKKKEEVSELPEKPVAESNLFDESNRQAVDKRPNELLESKESTAPTQVDKNESAELDKPSKKPLEGASTGEVSVAERGGNARASASGRGRPDVQRNDSTGREGVLSGGRLADGERKIPSTTTRGKPEGKPREPIRKYGLDAGAAKPGEPSATDRAVRRVEQEAPKGNVARKPDSMFTITDDTRIGTGGKVGKFRANLEAIRTLKKVVAEDREATKDEQKALARYVGWGGIPQAFYKANGTTTKGWESRAEELKGLLTKEEYEAARRSTQDAHYTSTEIVSAMWNAAKRLGFSGGRVLEPSVGAGNFIGLMPKSVRGKSQITGVELDHITGGIAKLLYPSANIQAPVGFESFVTQDNYFDFAIGNPPFGSQSLYDGKRKHLNKFSIHNFFFAKTIDSLKPNGVMAMVVSNSLLDSNGDKARQYIADKAEFLGAVRLPNNAFSKNAGTEVTTDIIFLRKLKENESVSGETWMNSEYIKDAKGIDVPLNEYFIRHPEMMLGTWGAYGSMYRPDAPALVANDGQDTGKLLEEAIAKLPKNIMDKPGAAPVEVVESTADVSSVKVGSMFMDNGIVKIRKEDEVGKAKSDEVEFKSEKAKSRVEGMVGVRDVLTQLRSSQLNDNSSNSELSTLRGRLNESYDSFVSSNGPINLEANKRLFRDDPTWPHISALEEGFDKGVSAAIAKKTGEDSRKPSAKKSAIFKKRTQSPYKKPESAASAKDALAASLLVDGSVDLGYMSSLYGKSEEAIISELDGLIFRNSADTWVSREEYLSGDVKQKLQVAEEFAETDRDWVKNIDALNTVMPEDIEAVDIEIKPGAHWLPSNVVRDFVSHALNSTKGTKARFITQTSKWLVDGHAGIGADTKWGTDRARPLDVIKSVLNQKQMVIRDRISSTEYATNESATTAANEKIDQLKTEFKRWLWADETRREDLSKLYNEKFNTSVRRSFDGSHLDFPGKISDDIIKLRPHQANAVWRIVQSGTTLLDHVVGAGKTFTMIAGAMEMRRMGKAKKPMFVVPNHLVGQWAEDFVKLYPGANILAANKNDFKKENRKRLFARISTGDWDAVIVAHSSFGFVGMDKDFEERFIKGQLADIEKSISIIKAEEGNDKRSVKEVEKQKDRLEAKLKKLFDAEGKDDNLTFGELGVDAVFLDEAHEFKNLGFTTGMSRVAGLGNPQGSNKAADMFMKIQYVLEKTGGSNVVFATGTPISNSMAEMYTMQRYLDYKALNEQGIAHFDSWAKMYGDVVSDWELSPSGKFKLNNRFAKFVNIPELMQRYLSFSDVINRDDINNLLKSQGKTLPVPKMKTGKPINLIVDRSQDQADYIGEASTDENGNDSYPEGTLVWRTENLPKKPGKGDDNMLAIMGHARKAALDMRLIDSSYGDNPDSKVNVASGNIKRLYDAWSKDSGAQLVFIDLSTPKGAKNAEAKRIRGLIEKAESGDEAAERALDRMSPDEFSALDGDFSVYDDLRTKLIEKGIPENEVAFIHDYNSEAKKDELFGKVRSGKIRVLLGSTAKMGAGMNVQERLVALHHLDAPWRPSDLEQREGRIIRQGNVLYDANPDGFEVEVLRYATKQTLDSRMWQTIESKARFIEQVRKGDSTERQIEDIAGEASNAAEMKAASSGNPLILEEMDLRQKIKKLEQLEVAHNREQHRIIRDAKYLKSALASNKVLLPKLKADAKQAETAPKKFAMTVDGTEFSKNKEAGAALIAAAKSMKKKGSESKYAGEYSGFPLVWDMVKDRKSYGDIKFVLTVEGQVEQQIQIDDPGSADPVGLSRRVQNTVKAMIDKPASTEAIIAEQEKAVKESGSSTKEWNKKDELSGIKKRHSEVIDELKPKKKEQESQKDEAKFSVAKNDRRPTKVTERVSKEDRQHQDQVETWIAPSTLKWGNNAPKVVVYSTHKDIPNDVLELAEEQFDPSSTKGWYSQGTVSLVASNLKDRVDTLKTLAHESIGHWGMTLQEDQFYQDIVSKIHALKRTDPYIKGLAKSVAEDYSGIDETVAAEEIIARVAEGMVSGNPVSDAVSNVWKRLVGTVRKFLRTIFPLQFTRSDIEAMLASSERALRSNIKSTRKDNTDKPLFSTGSIENLSPEDGRKRLEDVLDSTGTKAFDKIADVIAGNKLVEAGKMGALKTVTLRQLGDLASKILPQINQYVDVVNKMLTRRNQMAEKAADMVEVWQKWAAKNRKGADKLHDLMHEATLAQVDPSEEYVDITEHLEERLAVVQRAIQSRSGDSGKKKTALDEEHVELLKDIEMEPDRKTRWEKLRPQWEKLTPEAQETFKKVRDEYKDRHDIFERLLVSRIENAQIDGRKKKEMLAKLRHDFETQELTGPYFPLARFGRYWVSTVDENAEPVYLTFESALEQKRTIKNLESEGYATKSGHMLDSTMKQDSASMGFVNDVVSLIENSSINDEKSVEISDAVYQLYLQSMPTRSMRHNFQHRKGTQGYSKNAIRAFAENMMKGAYQLSRLEYQDEFAELMDSMRKEAGTAGDNRKGLFYNEMIKRNEWVMNPTNSVVSQKLTALGFVWMLGVSPAAAMVNLTQTFVVALPVIGARYGAVQTAKELVKASRGFRIKDGKIDEENLTQGERDAMQAWADSGMLDSTRAHDLAGIAENGGYAYSNVQEKVMRGVSFLFHRAEQFNREVTALSAYRLAIKKHGEGYHQKAITQAEKLTWESHFDYGNTNRAPFMQGNVAKVALQFKQYSQNITYYLMRNVLVGFKKEGWSTEERVVARRQLLGTLGMTALIGGMNALPLAALFGLANMMWDDEDEPFDAREEFFAYLVEATGSKSAADAIMNGAGGAGVSGRISLDGLWVRDSNRDLEGQDLWAFYAAQVAGPTLGGIIPQWLEGGRKISNGQTWRGVENFSPVFLRNALKSVRYNNEGALNLKGDELKSREDFNAAELFTQGIGFTDAGVIKQYTENSAIKGAAEKIKKRRRFLITQYYMAWKDGDADEKKEVLRKIRRFNKHNPRFPVSASTLSRSLKTRERYRRESLNGINVNKRLRYLADDRDFVN